MRRSLQEFDSWKKPIKHNERVDLGPISPISNGSSLTQATNETYLQAINET